MKLIPIGFAALAIMLSACGDKNNADTSNVQTEADSTVSSPVTETDDSSVQIDLLDDVLLAQHSMTEGCPSDALTDTVTMSKTSFRLGETKCEVKDIVMDSSDGSYVFMLENCMAEGNPEKARNVKVNYNGDDKLYIEGWDETKRTLYLCN